MQSDAAGATEAIKGTAAGVPFVALPPRDTGDPAPLLISWHFMDPPCTEAAMAAALPLADVPAWRVHLGLPMFGSRLPDGGFERIFALAAEDYVRRLFEPVVTRAVAELPAALTELRAQLPVTDAPLTLVGGSAGGAAVLLALAEAGLDVGAAVAISPVVQLAPVVAAGEREHGVTYAWTDTSRAVADRFDFVARAGELPDVPLLVVTGADDEVAFREPARLLCDRLGGRAQQVVVDDMAHGIAEPPGVEPAPQTPQAARVDAEVSAWLLRHLR
ncbi:prolyl oligopeptidase family protein [Prauserella shujinwangii]|uniref:Prolyl oligopeptidase family protein n=1 Tax=Prauserella shujinwangii TaxID=1453103 RepID=A0A2T0LSQ4_9PSEU|nr:prolyl oligopeptidase family serine peptidase [Prauserella shujinwangii]PRX46701.1 prolyl oligopeptidase family protein [Prauserella shujinwangii]